MSEPKSCPDLATPCRHLRNKEMYYATPGQDDDEYGVCWCSKSQETVGPDGEPVSKTDCCTGRSCYVA